MKRATSNRPGESQVPDENAAAANDGAPLTALMYSVREMKMFPLQPRRLCSGSEQTGEVVPKFRWCLGDGSGRGNYLSEIHINI